MQEQVQFQLRAVKETTEGKNNPHKTTKMCLAYDVMMKSELKISYLVVFVY